MRGGARVRARGGGGERGQGEGREGKGYWTRRRKKPLDTVRGRCWTRGKEARSELVRGRLEEEREGVGGE